MNINALQIPTAGGFRYRNNDGLVYEQRWHVQGTILEFDEPIEIDMGYIEQSDPPVIHLDCIHRGPQVGERQCPSCSGKVQLKVFACDIHKQTTIARQVDGLACCATCDDYEKDQDNDG